MLISVAQFSTSCFTLYPLRVLIYYPAARSLRARYGAGPQWASSALARFTFSFSLSSSRHILLLHLALTLILHL
jgi:hypothetical protein